LPTCRTFSNLNEHFEFGKIKTNTFTTKHTDTVAPARSSFPLVSSVVLGCRSADPVSKFFNATIQTITELNKTRTTIIDIGKSMLETSGEDVSLDVYTKWCVKALLQAVAFSHGRVCDFFLG
jgi:hypothetical protein